MIVSAVADPSIFGNEAIKDQLSKREAIAFLQGIIDNGVLLDDPTRGLLREALLMVSQLGTKLGQRIQLLLEEIQKQHKKFVVSCDRMRWERQSCDTVADKCVALASLLKADAIITHSGNEVSIKQRAKDDVEVVVISDLTESSYETTRRRMQHIEDSLDNLPAEEVAERIGRAVKYTATLRVFDYRMIGAEQQARKYLAGIQFIAAIWQRWCVVGDSNSRTIELYTVGNCMTQNGFLNATAADSRLETHIQVPLANVVLAKITRCLKQDREPAIFHARGFEARKRAYTFDPGFDAIGPTGAIRACLFKAERAAERHFDECRKLKDLP